MQRVFYKDGTFLDCKVSWEYENDPDWDRTEDSPEDVLLTTQEEFEQHPEKFVNTEK